MTRSTPKTTPAPRWPALVPRLGLCVLLLAGTGGRAAADDGAHAHADAPARPARHLARSVREVQVPEVRLVRDDGKVVSLREELDDGRPVVLNFIFTTCTSICPIMSAVFSQFEHRLGDEARKVHMVSISIDPEQDTPARLAEYARRFHAGLEWQHYTGTVEASLAAQRAFGVYNGAKMSHSALTLLRAAPGKPWVRIDGIASPDDLVREYRTLVAGR